VGGEREAAGVRFKGMRWLWRRGAEREQVPHRSSTPAPPTPAAASPPTPVRPTGRGERLSLDVPFAEKDQAKRNGARWDPGARTWFAPPGSNLDGLRRWLPRRPGPFHGPPIFVRLALLPETCYRCGELIAPIAVVLREGDIAPIEIAAAAEGIAATFTAAELATAE